MMQSLGAGMQITEHGLYRCRPIGPHLVGVAAFNGIAKRKGVQQSIRDNPKIIRAPEMAPFPEI